MKKLSFAKISSKGFTLIELLVVIAVLGVLAAGVLTAINPLKRIQQANDAKIKNDIGQIAQAEQAYFTTNQVYTTTTTVLAPANGTGDLKVFPVAPANSSYNFTGNAGLTDITVYGALTETGQGFWCWESATAKAGRVAAAPTPATATSCGTFL